MKERMDWTFFRSFIVPTRRNGVYPIRLLELRLSLRILPKIFGTISKVILCHCFQIGRLNMSFSWTLSIFLKPWILSTIVSTSGFARLSQVWEHRLNLENWTMSYTYLEIMFFADVLTKRNLPLSERRSMKCAFAKRMCPEIFRVDLQ